MFYFLERSFNLTKFLEMFHTFEKAIARRGKGVHGMISFSILEFANIARTFIHSFAESGICCKYLHHDCGKGSFKSSFCYGFNIV